MSPISESLRATASFGAAAFPTYDSVDALVGAADEALYEAKQSGKNRVATATAKRKKAGLPGRPLAEGVS